LLACAASCSGRTAPADGGASAGYTKIDDMEGSGRMVEWMPPSGLLPTVWYAATDCNEAGNIWPPPDAFVDGVFTPAVWSHPTLPTPHETFPGIISTQAARLRTTSPLVDVWGANIAFAFAWMPGLVPEIVPDAAGSDPAACPIVLGPQAAVDLSAYSGVTFWAKGDPAGLRAVKVMFLDGNTDPRGGICNHTDTNSPDFCYNGFSQTIALTDTFAQYTVDFASLQQDPAWGYRPRSGVLDVHHVYQLVFQVDVPVCYPTQMCVGGSAPPVTFDFWIDDLYFVNK